MGIVTRKDADGRYLNPHPHLTQEDQETSFLRWALHERIKSRRENQRRGERLPEPVARPGEALAAAREGLHVTWAGHSSMIVRINGRTLLFDPVWSPSAGFAGRVGVKRLTPPGVPWHELPKVDALVLSHNHYDHLDVPTLRRLPRDTPVYCPMGVGALVRRLGFADVTEREWWGDATRDGLRLTLTPAQHFSRRGLADTDRTLWGGWVAEADGYKVYFAGDTGWMETGFKEIGQRFRGLDVALMPIGAYLPRWFMRPVHVDPEEAGRGWLDTGARVMVPMHWGTFRLADEAMDQPPDDLLRWAKTEGDASRVRLPRLGETLALDGRR